MMKRFAAALLSIAVGLGVTLAAYAGGFGGLLNPYAISSAAPFTVSFLTSATSSGTTITIPAGAAAGDWAILFDQGSGASPPSLVTPTNWTQVSGINDTANNMRGTISQKKLVGGDPGASVTGMAGGNESKIMFVFRGSAAIGTVTVSTWNHQATSGNPTLQTTTASAGVAPLVVFGVISEQSGGGAPTFSTVSPNFDAEVTSNSRTRAGYSVYNDTPGDQTLDGNDNGSGNWLASGYIELAP